MTEILTPASVIRNDLDSHPALLSTIKTVLENHFDVEVTWTFAEPFSYLGLGWNIPPKIQPKGGETNDVFPMEAHAVVPEGGLCAPDERDGGLESSGT